MNKQQLTKLLESFKSGDTELDTIANVLLSDAAQKLQHATIDTERAARTGQPETVFGESKTPEQIVPIVQVLNDHQQAALVTRIDSIKGECCKSTFRMENGTCWDEPSYSTHPPFTTRETWL